MVSFRYAKEQQEEAARHERLLAARRVAAELSVRNARDYEAQKRRQRAAVRADLEAQWRDETQAAHFALTQAVDDGERKMGRGMQQAAVLVEAAQQEAQDGAAAWAAQGCVDAARHRLALAARRMEAGNRGAMTERRRAVRAVENERAARVAAAPPPKTYGDVQAELAPPLPLEERRLLRARGRGGAAHCPPVAGGVSPRLVDVPEAAARFDYRAEAAAAAVQQRTQATAEERAELTRRQHEEAAQRATEALRQQRQQAEQREREERERRERLRVIAAEYRGPPPPPSPEKEPASSDDGGAGTATGSVGGSAAAAAAHPLTRRQRVLDAVREAAGEFERVFVHGPPVLLRERVAMPDCAPRTLDDLLRPATLAELLPPQSAAVEWDGDDGAGDCAADVPTAAVLPCRFETQPIPVVAGLTGDGEGRRDEAAASEEAAAATASSGAEETGRSTTQEERCAEDVPSGIEPVNEVGLNPQLPPADGNNSSTDRQRVPQSATGTTSPAADESVAASQTAVGPVPQNETAVLSDISAHSYAAVPPAASAAAAGASSQSTSSPPSTCHDSLNESEATFASSASTATYPTMTAEQLKIALIRLRNRARAAYL